MLALSTAAPLAFVPAPALPTTASTLSPGAVSVDMRDKRLPKTSGKTATRSIYGYTVSQGIGPADIGFSRRVFRFDKETQVGAQAPLGFWDPLDLSTDQGEGEDTAKFLRYREVEVKHGRVAMLACLGYIVPYFSKLPGSLTLDGSVTFDSVPLGVRALQALPPAGVAQILLLVGLLEFGPFKSPDIDPTLDDPPYPGDLGFDPLDLATGLDQEDLDKKRAAELANGRLAMVASLGFLVLDVLNGNPYAGGPFEAFL